MSKEKSRLELQKEIREIEDQFSLDYIDDLLQDKGEKEIETHFSLDYIDDLLRDKDEEEIDEEFIKQMFLDSGISLSSDSESKKRLHKKEKKRTATQEEQFAKKMKKDKTKQEKIAMELDKKEDMKLAHAKMIENFIPRPHKWDKVTGKYIQRKKNAADSIPLVDNNQIPPTGAIVAKKPKSNDKKKIAETVSTRPETDENGIYLKNNKGDQFFGYWQEVSKKAEKGLNRTESELLQYRKKNNKVVIVKGQKYHLLSNKENLRLIENKWKMIGDRATADSTGQAIAGTDMDYLEDEEKRKWYKFENGRGLF